MTVVYLILLVLAAGCFALSSWGRGRFDNRVSLIPLGLLLWVLVPLLQTLKIVGD